MDLHHHRLRVVAVAAVGSAIAAVIVATEAATAAGSVRVQVVTGAIEAALVDRAKAGGQDRMRAQGLTPASSMP